MAPSSPYLIFDMNPIIFETKFFTLHTIWLFFAIATIAGVYTLIKLSIRNGLKLQFLSENSWKLLIWSIIGARIISILLHLDFYFYEFSITTFFKLFFIWDKGLDIWGAIAAFLICLYHLCRNSEQSFWKWLDVLVPSVILSFAISHIGAFFGAINYGSPTSLPWGVNFESPLIKYAVPIHPTQIYAFLYSTLLTIGLIMASHHEKIKNIEKPGLLGLSGIMAYTFFRFLEDFIRGDDTFTIFDIRLTKFTIPLIMIFTGVLIHLRYTKPRRKLEISKHN